MSYLTSFRNYCEEKAQEIADIPKKPSPDDEHWGYHLLLDISGCNENMNKEDKLRAFLKELLKKLGMTPVGKPIVKMLSNSRGRGYSVVQLITTSTITMHSDDEKMCVYMDVFSCKPYEPKTVFDLVKEYFEPKHIGHKWFYRDAGTWPHKKSSSKSTKE